MRTYYLFAPETGWKEVPWMGYYTFLIRGNYPGTWHLVEGHKAAVVIRRDPLIDPEEDDAVFFDEKQSIDTMLNDANKLAQETPFSDQVLPSDIVQDEPDTPL